VSELAVRLFNAVEQIEKKPVAAFGPQARPKNRFRPVLSLLENDKKESGRALQT